MWRTFVLATIVSLLTMLLGTTFALGLAVAPRWLSIVMLICLFTIFWTSLVVRTYGWILLYLPKGPIYIVLHALGIVNEPINIYQTNFASYPAMVHVMLPYVVLPVFAAARQIDPTLIRAARVLGARTGLILWKIVLPALRAGMAAGAVMVFVMSLGFYVTPTLLGSQTAQLVSGLIGVDFNQPAGPPVAAAMSVALLVIVIIVYIIADRLFKVSEQWGAN
jgi:putative spermidine/putrescine transport system permease protein